MPGGRPKDPIAIRRAKGDTQKLGASKHEAAITDAFEARRGRPPLPESLVFVAIEGEEPKSSGVRKRLLDLAKSHWEYLADELGHEKLLASLDEGMLTTTALIYAQMVMSGSESRVKEFVDLSQRYMQAADRMGLNESARVKLPKRGEQKKDAGQSAMSAFLASRKPA